MTIWYLDNEDEITDAVARLRQADDESVVFVVPPGSRIATGRINFKLLAREAASRDLAMAVASPDEQVRALAASAGVLSAATPDAAEAALERGDEPPRPEPAAEDEDRPTVVAGSAPPPERGVLSWRSQRLRVVTLTMLVLVVVAGYVVTQMLPTAEITLVPRVSSLGPLEVPVRASADVSEVDVESGAIPAVSLSVPLFAEITHPSSGELVTDTKATGSVVFRSPSQDSEQEIGEGTRVRTPAEVEFRTTETVVLPRSVDGAAAEVVAPIEAVTGGEAGNVGAGRINQVPTLADQGISVSNPEATSGGRTDISPLVGSGDYDDAVENLENLLRGRLRAYVDDPANAPAGLTVFSETRVLGPVTLDPPPEDVVGTAAAEISLSGSAEALVMAVDESAVDEVTRARVLASIPAGLELLPETLEVGHEEGTADGTDVSFIGTASGQTVTVVDRDALLEQIAGLPISNARAILERLGTATVNVWPGFIGDLPDDLQRITLDVEEASTTE